MPNSQYDVYVVDDDDVVRGSLRILLELEGFAVYDFPSGRAFLDAGLGNTKGCILLDLRMPDMDGFEVLRALQSRNESRPVIVLTGHGNAGIESRLLASGVHSMLNKPVDADDLLRALHTALATLK